MDKAQLNKAYFEVGDWLHTTYKTIPILKYTNDLWQHKAILDETNPDVIIETGTLDGASAWWFSDNSNATVYSIEKNDRHIAFSKNDRIKFIHADSLDVEIDVSTAKRIMVVLDSDHSKDHVLAELKKYAPLVSKGCYLVVEDTFISQYLNNQDPNNDYSNGSSWEAVQEWDSTGFEQQPDMFTLSMNPGGWFKRV